MSENEEHKSIFISHATPDDNIFTMWLALKLISLGYEVWCDLLKLDKSVDFWKEIDSEIRNNTIQFIYVLSEKSNYREGTLKELAVAEKVKNSLKDKTFITPIIIDKKLSYDDINIDLIRLNIINFKDSWAIGLNDLISFLHKKKITYNKENYYKSALLYKQIVLQNRQEIKRDEIYDSNWYPIVLPKELQFHRLIPIISKDTKIKDLKYPAIPYKDYIVTFTTAYDFLNEIPKIEFYDSSETIRIPITDVLSGKFESQFINNNECKKIIVRLLNLAFVKFMRLFKVQEYNMSGSIGYWIEDDVLKKNKYNKVLLVGTLKEKHWHYGISCYAKLVPEPMYVFTSHIFFTKDGHKIIESKAIQHTSRRKQGKDWWNNDWRKKMSAFIKYISNNNDVINVFVGSQAYIIFSSLPLVFKSEITYNIPSKNNLKEETDISNINDIEEEVTE